MIGPNTKVKGHRPPLKPIDINHIGRPRFISREEIEDNVRKEPCHEAYSRDINGNFTLKDGK